MKYKLSAIKSAILILCVLVMFSGCINVTENTVSNSSQTSAILSQPLHNSSVVSTPSASSNQTNGENYGTTSTTTPQTETFTFSFDSIPAYTGTPYVALNNNTPVFSKQEISTTASEVYSP